VDTAEHAERKAKLEAYVANSQLTRKRVVLGAAAGAVVGLVIAFAIHGVVGAVITTGAVAFGLCGAWITTAHVWTFRGQLKDLKDGKLDPQVIHVKQGRGRYQR
jgi:ammonia channel protein AmtB